jgi:hypothetical protein
VDPASPLLEVEAAAHVQGIVHAVGIGEADPRADTNQVEGVRGMRNRESHEDGYDHERGRHHK